MKSLSFPIVFEFYFVIMLAGTKTVPTGETPSIGRSQNKACHGRPQLVRKSQYTLLIGIFFVPWAGNKYAIFRPVPI